MRNLLIFVLLSTSAELFAQEAMEPILFRYLTMEKPEKVKIKKAQHAIKKCGYDYQYDSIQQQIILNFYDFNYLPGFIKKRKDGIALHINNNEFFISRNRLRDQFISSYWKRNLALHAMEFYNDLVKYIPTVSLPENNLNLRKQYRFFKAQLKEADLNKRQLKKAKYVTRKNFKDFKQDFRYFKKLIKGKRAFLRSLRNDNNPWPVTFNISGNYDPEFNFEFTSYKKSVATLKFDTLAGKPADFLPEQENVKCIPFDRYTYFKKLKGLGLQKYNYDPYVPPQKQIGFRKFEIFFERNQSDCSYEDIRDIVTLMNDSSYTIKKAKIRAYASVEGFTEINLRLQKERAQLLLDLLQQYNQDSIEVVSLKTDENWDRLYRQLKGTSYEYWQDLSKSEIKDLLTNPKILNEWEDSLYAQRKAVLEVLLYRKADPVDQVKAAVKDYHQIRKQYTSLSKRNADDQALRPYLLKLLAIEHFLNEKAREGVPFADSLCNIQRTPDPSLALVQFYSLILEDFKGLSAPCKNHETIILNAYHAVLHYLNEVELNRHRQQYFLRQAIDIQIYAFEKVEDGSIDPEIICQLKWPDTPLFYPLVLNELDYINRFTDNELRQLSCYQQEKDTNNNDPDFESNPENVHAISFAPPLDYKLPHSDYYFLLKKKLVHNDQLIRSWAVRTDDILEFDLYEFLFINILNWDVWNNVYYDEEVNYKEMLKQMNRLLEIHDILCDKQLYQIYLDLHLRIGYLLRHDISMDQEVLNSLRKLTQYYQKHLTWMPEKEAMKLVRHLLWMGQYYHKNETYEMAAQLLSNMSRHDLLNKKNQNLLDEM